MTTGPEAEALVLQAGVVRITQFRWRPEGGFLIASGNGLYIGDHELLTIQHVVQGDETSLLINGEQSDAVVLERPESWLEKDAWVLLRTERESPAPPCSLPHADNLPPGQPILVVGHWIQDDGWIPTGHPIAVSGTIIETPEVYSGQVDSAVFLDLGPDSDNDGLSGSPILVQDSEGQWRLAGVYQGFVETTRPGDRVSLMSPVLDLFEARRERRLAPGDVATD